MASSDKWLKLESPRLFYDTYFNDKFILDSAGVTDLANFLIAPGFSIAFWDDPIKWLSTLICYPYDVTHRNYVVDGDLKIGTRQTTIYAKYASSYVQWYNMGECYIQPHFNNFADYNGYTKIEVWLPYLGFVSVEPNDVIGKYLEFALSVDIGTGQGTYYIGVSDSHITPDETNPEYAGSIFENTRILSTHSFQLGYQIPLGASNATEIYRNIIGGAVKAASVAVGAYAVGAVGGSVATTKTSSVKTVRNPQTGRQITQSKQVRESVTDTSAYLKGKAVNAVFEYSGESIANMHIGVNMDRVNNPAVLCNGSTSIKVVIYRPKLQSINADYKHIYGVPLGTTKVLSTLSGYTEVSELHLESVDFGTATENELGMIKEQLLNGVILP